MIKNSRPWLKALSALSSNISAAWLAVAFIGPNISVPKNTKEILVLILYIMFGIIFLLITVLLEKELET